MPNHNVRQSIATEGLKPYLDRTRDEHHGYDYAEHSRLKRLGRNRKQRAELAGVHEKTMQKWDDIDAAELARRAGGEAG